MLAELDSRRFHASRAAFERDREKGNALAVAGFVLLRLTWHQLVDDQRGVAEMLRALLDEPRK